MHACTEGQPAHVHTMSYILHKLHVRLGGRDGPGPGRGGTFIHILLSFSRFRPEDHKAGFLHSTCRPLTHVLHACLHKIIKLWMQPMIWRRRWALSGSPQPRRRLRYCSLGMAIEGKRCCAPLTTLFSLPPLVLRYVLVTLPAPHYQAVDKAQQ